MGLTALKVGHGMCRLLRSLGVSEHIDRENEQSLHFLPIILWVVPRVRFPAAVLHHIIYGELSRQHLSFSLAAITPSAPYSFAAVFNGKM